MSRIVKIDAKRAIIGSLLLVLLIFISCFGGSDEQEQKESDRFSFFVTSLEAMRELSGSQDGFGGDLGGLAGVRLR